MRYLRSILAAMFVAAAVPSMAAEPLGTLLPDSELRLNADMGWERRSDVWQLRADGTITGNFQISRSVTFGTSFTRSGRIAGRWRIENGKLCVEGTGFEQRGLNCYALTKGGFSANEYGAVNDRNGQRWQVFVYSR